MMEIVLCTMGMGQHNGARGPWGGVDYIVSFTGVSDIVDAQSVISSGRRDGCIAAVAKPGPLDDVVARLIHALVFKKYCLRCLQFHVTRPNLDVYMYPLLYLTTSNTRARDGRSHAEATVGSVKLTCT